MSSTIYKCKACGAENKLEEKSCRTCGAENVLRLEKIAKLESRWKRIEKRRDKSVEIVTERKTMLGTRSSENRDIILAQKSRKLRLELSKLETEGTHEGKLRLVKRQYYELNMTIQDIADDLGVSMMTVRKHLNEIEKQDIIRVGKHLDEIENQDHSK